MSHLLDRSLQRQILEALSEIYPAGTYAPQSLPGLSDASEAALIVNIAYLGEHGLLKSGVREIKSHTQSTQKHFDQTAITASGLDFLQADGGLSAILDTVTIRIDSRQFAEMLAAKIESNDKISHEDRSSIASAVRNLPAKAIEKLSSKAIDWAVENLPNKLEQLRMLLAQVAG